MKKKKRTAYKIGQRWEFASDVAEFESQLIIGRAYDCTSISGKKVIHFNVYIPYSATARDSLPPNVEGQVLRMTAADLDLNVTNLIESDVELPFWWECGYRVESPDKMPYIEGIPGWNPCMIRDHLPELFDRRKNDRMRIDALQKEQNRLKKLGPPKRSRSVAESWKRIAAFMKNGKQGFRVNERASPAAIKRLEKLIGSKLPNDFRKSLEIYDGGDWWVFPNYGEFLPSAEIERQWSMYKEWQDNGTYANDSGDWKVRDSRGPIKPVFWNLKRVPISDNSGDHLMLDLDPPEDGTYGQILDHSHEVGPERVVAASWSDFLANLVHDLESGKYICDESGYLKRIEDE